MAWPFQRGGKSSGNRKHSKIDKLPPEMKATVEEMILDGSATYTEIVDYLQEHGYSLSVSSVCRYAQGYVENLQTLQIAQANFRNMLDELERYPDLDTTEALVRVGEPGPYDGADRQEGRGLERRECGQADEPDQRPDPRGRLQEARGAAEQDRP